MFDHFNFLQPFWLLLLPLLLALFFLIKQTGGTTFHWRQVCDPELLPFLEYHNNGSSHAGLVKVTLIAAVILVLAAAQPVWKQKPQPVFQEPNHIVIALDLSVSMNATDIKPSRLQRAQFKIKDLLKYLPDTQVALIVYAAEPFLVSPLTEDSGTILAQLPVMSPEIMPSQGSRADLALKKADQLLSQAGITQGDIILISDEVLPTQIAAVAKELKIAGRRLSIIGVGTEQGGSFSQNGNVVTDLQGNVIVKKTHLEDLEESAALGGGRAVMITQDDSDVVYIANGLKGTDQLPEEAKEKLKLWVAEGPLLVLIVLPLLLPLFRKGILQVLLPVIFSVASLTPMDLYASPETDKDQTTETVSIWRNLWKTPDKQGYDLYQQGDADKAVDRFKDLRWKQLSYYRIGDYEQSLVTLEKLESPEDWYNRGNILARLGRLDEAVEAYDVAIKQKPEYEKAIHNRTVVQEFKKEKQHAQEQFGPRGSKPDEGGEGESGDISNEQSNKQDGSAGGNKQSGNSPVQNSVGQGNNSQSDLDAEETLETSTEKSVPKQQSRQLIDEYGAARAQMLNSIKNDPTGLWRRKFILQYRQHSQQHPLEAEQW